MSGLSYDSSTGLRQSLFSRGHETPPCHVGRSVGRSVRPCVWRFFPRFRFGFGIPQNLSTGLSRVYIGFLSKYSNKKMFGYLPERKKMREKKREKNEKKKRKKERKEKKIEKKKETNT